jgi:chitodextrinase
LSFLLTTTKIVKEKMSTSSKIPKKPVLDNPTETTFTAEWEPVEGAKAYKVYVREYPKPWESAEVLDVSGNKAETTLVEGRFPTSTYQVRIVAVFEDGSLSQPSEEATVDTAVSNCVPEKKNKCVIM